PAQAGIDGREDRQAHGRAGRVPGELVRRNINPNQFHCEAAIPPELSLFYFAGLLQGHSARQPAHAYDDRFSGEPDAGNCLSGSTRKREVAPISVSLSLLSTANLG